MERNRQELSDSVQTVAADACGHNVNEVSRHNQAISSEGSYR